MKNLSSLDSTEEYIVSILEEMSKLASVLSSSTEPNSYNSKNSRGNHIEKEKSVEELLEEAEELINQKCSSSEEILKSDEVSDSHTIEDNTKIFEKIEQEVRRESEKNKNSPCEKSQETRFQNEEIKLNSQKELTNVDNNIFDDMLRKYIEDPKDLKSCNSSFQQEDENKSINSNSTLNCTSEFSDDQVSSSSSMRKRNSSKNQKYTLNLIPRLELFADSISKLKAEKLSQISKIPKQESEVKEIHSLNQREREKSKPSKIFPKINKMYNRKWSKLTKLKLALTSRNNLTKDYLFVNYWKGRYHKEKTEMRSSFDQKLLSLKEENSILKEKCEEQVAEMEEQNQQNLLLKDELKMFQLQLTEKNKFIAVKLEEMTATEIQLRKEIEDLKVDLNTRSETLRENKLKYEKLRENALPLENKLVQLQEKLAEVKNQVRREKLLSEKLKSQVILDSTKIRDLTRQIFEMERIIKRKNLDSVSALIYSANSDQDGLHLEKIKLLEERNATLENEIKAKEKAGQKRLADFKREFVEMKNKFRMEITELQNKKSETEKTEKLETSEVERLKELQEQDIKNEVVHLTTSICRLKLELSNRNKDLAKLSKEFQELQKTNRRLQKEREKELDEHVYKDFYSKSKNDRSSNSSSGEKFYDPLQYSEESGSNGTTKLAVENSILREELGKVRKEFLALKKKRLRDLNLLQEEHEREITDLIKKYCGNEVKLKEEVGVD